MSISGMVESRCPQMEQCGFVGEGANATSRMDKLGR
jgi:hypothetical protein